MGFVLTLLYITLTITSPGQFGEGFASFHPMVYLGVVAVVASIPSLLTNHQWRWSLQVRLFIGFVAAIVLSRLANGWLSGAAQSLGEVLPSIGLFSLVVVNTTTIKRIKIMILVIVATCLAIAGQSIWELYSVPQAHLLASDGQIMRLRAAGFLNDPNDLAQFLLIGLPLVFVYWNQGRAIRNTVMVLVPAALLCWALYLTHSRGALITLAVIATAAFHNKLGKTRSLILVGMLIFGMFAVDFTGGRAISVTEGADRLEAWATGLELFKKSPIFGIGFERFTDFSDITAHNSFVLCLAELGLVGNTFLVALMVTTLSQLTTVIKYDAVYQMSLMPYGQNDESTCQKGVERNKSATHCVNSDDGIGVPGAVKLSESEDSLKQVASVVQLSLISFITTSWFLSRIYTGTMYITLGLAIATLCVSREEGVEADDRARWVPVTLAVEMVAIIAIYLVVRSRH